MWDWTPESAATQIRGDVAGTLETLANLAGMSRTSFANYFKDVMQVPPGKYLENLRLAIARQLVQTGVGLKQIAARTGYASPSTLSRALGRSI